MSFPARYYTDSAACCGESIEPGDLITYDGDDVVHEECARNADIERSRSGGIPAFGPRRH